MLTRRLGQGKLQIYTKISQHLEMEAQPFRAELPAGEFRSSCLLPSHCKGAWFGICQLSTSQWAEDRNGFVIPSCKWSLCCVRTAAASARRSKKEPRLLLNIHLSSRSSGRQAGPELTCGLCYLVTLPGTLNHACAFTGVSCLRTISFSC